MNTFVDTRWRWGWIALFLLAAHTSRGACTYSLSPTNRMHGYGATSNFVNVYTGPTCGWSVINTNPWISFTASSGTGTGMVGYLVAANPNPVSRTGVVMIANQSFTLRQNAVECSYSISPLNRNHGHGMATNSVTVTTAGGCSWVTSNTNAWITILSGASGIGNGTVTYKILANTNPVGRTGIVMIADRVFSLTQSNAPCNLDIAPTERAHGAGPETNSVAVTGGSGCVWLTANTNAWIQILSGASGSGNGMVTYTVAANPTENERSGTLTIAGKPYLVSQIGIGCSYKLSPTNRFHGYRGTNGTITVIAGDGCAWTVVNPYSWIIITSGANGVGPGTVTYAIDDNLNSVERTGLLAIGGQTFTLTQRALSCSVSISPADRTHGHGAAANSITVTTSATCPWAVANSNSWISIVSGASGVGNGTVSYTVQPNASALPRSGAVVIEGELFFVTQLGLPCTFEISPTTRVHGNGAATNTISVTASNDCVWSVTNNNTWIHITTPLSGTGSDVVGYSVEPNPSFVERTGMVMIAGQMLTVRQRGISCSFSISPVSRMHGYAATTNTVEITTGSGCIWTVINTNEWVEVLSGLSGTGSDVLTYAVQPNLSLNARSGVVMIDGQALALTQEGYQCSYRISPTTRTHGFGAATGMVSMTTSINCPWNVINTNAWVAITSDFLGYGNATIAYTVAPNFSPTLRSGVVMIADQALVLSQRGATNGFVLDVMAVESNGQVRLRMAGAPEGVWQLQGSPDLVRWTRISEVTNATGVVEYIDANGAHFNHRFYRAVLP